MPVALSCSLNSNSDILFPGSHNYPPLPLRGVMELDVGREPGRASALDDADDGRDQYASEEGG